MKRLALDASTPTASIALLEDDIVVHQAFWTAHQARHENIVAHVAEALAPTGWAWEALGEWVVGRGPGAYAGLRASLLAAQALAAPSEQPVVAVSSMEAMALRIMDEHALEELTVVGDARRRSLWYAHLERKSLVGTAATWSLLPLEAAPERLHAAHKIATPHSQALAALRESINPSAWLPGDQLPTAADLAHLLILRQKVRASPEPLTPLYLHAAV